jgi:hypothetical protein
MNFKRPEVHNHLGLNSWQLTYVALHLNCPSNCLYTLQSVSTRPNFGQIRSLRSRVVTILGYRGSGKTTLACSLVTQPKIRIIAVSLLDAESLKSIDIANTTIILDEVDSNRQNSHFYQFVKRVAESEIDCQLILIFQYLNPLAVRMNPFTDLFFVDSQPNLYQRQQICKFLNFRESLYPKLERFEWLLKANRLSCIVSLV